MSFLFVVNEETLASLQKRAPETTPKPSTPHPAKIKATRIRAYREWTGRELKILTGLLSIRMGREDISRKLGRSVASCSGAVKRYGLYKAAEVERANLIKGIVRGEGLNGQ
tara:strand:+ start:3641 stop:3973 length:333 start_codon:yes stop_codon:yes gene_type:complete